MNEVLTRDEIKTGFDYHKIHLTEDEWTQFMNELDENGDGVISYEEWCDILSPQLNAE